MLLTLFNLAASERVQTLAQGFYGSKHMSSLLDIWASHAEGAKQLEDWMLSKGFTIYEKRIGEEMNKVTKKFRFNLDDATPETLMNFRYQTEVEDVVTTLAPLTCRMLGAAVQSKRAARDNTKKTPVKVIFRHLLA